MPIYEYVCEACGRLIEVMQKMSDPAPAACPECGGSRLAKLVSRTTFRLKGGGWYSDLYATPKKKAAEGAGGGRPGDGSGSAARGTDGASSPAAGARTQAGRAETPAGSPAKGAGKHPAGSSGTKST